jgi:hypothetical protein
LVRPQWQEILAVRLNADTMSLMPSSTGFRAGGQRSDSMDVDQDRTGLLIDRWRPYFFGCLVGLPVAVVMLQV